MTPEENNFNKIVRIKSLGLPEKNNLPKSLDQCNACVLKVGPFINSMPPELNADSPFLFVDRNPSRLDSSEGKRLCSKSPIGTIFNSYLKELCLSRDEISLTTIIKCPILSDNAPTPYQIRKCSGWLKSEVRKLNNLKFLFLMGDFPVRVFLNWDLSLLKYYGVSYYLEEPNPLVIFPILAPGHVCIEHGRRDLIYSHLRFIRENYLEPYRMFEGDKSKWKPF